VNNIAAHVLQHELADAGDLDRAVAQPELVQHDQHGMTTLRAMPS
jgi:hypothetical protein